jgi:hypothetical protein
VPAETEIAPPAPLRASPELMATEPLSPNDVVPLRSYRRWRDDGKDGGVAWMHV